MPKRIVKRFLQATGLNVTLDKLRKSYVSDISSTLHFYEKLWKQNGWNKNTLVFDVGGNVGNHSEALLKLGAQVVCVEPQDYCIKILRHRFKGNSSFKLEEMGLAALPGEKDLFMSDSHTITSMSEEWISNVKKSGRFSQFNWKKSKKVNVSTLDELIRKHGLPAYCKIDVEGYEGEIIRGLSQTIACVSFEFTKENMDVLQQCLKHLSSLGNYRYNILSGNHTWELHKWSNMDKIIDTVKNSAEPDFTGDVYALLA